MNIDITDIIVSAIGLVGLIMTGIVIPALRTWVKSKVTNEQWETIKNYALAGVQAAEILIGAGNGAKKFEQCAAHGIKIDTDTIQIAIENAWKELGLDHEEKISQPVGIQETK